VIEAYVVSTDEYGNFLNRYLFKLWLQPQLKQLVLVSLLTSNNYVDYRLGNKVYIKLKDQYTDIKYMVH
jgi:hypothetical protein